MEKPIVTDLVVTWDAVLRWYFELQLSRGIPADIMGYARDNGFEHELDFRRAVLREYCYSALSA
jgi:hypothetical protein